MPELIHELDDATAAAISSIEVGEMRPWGLFTIPVW
jgi:hypothetical protein